MKVQNLLILRLPTMVTDEDAGLKSSSGALKQKHLQKTPRVLEFYGDSIRKAFTPEPEKIHPAPPVTGVVGMYLVAHGAFTGKTTNIAGQDPAVAAAMIDSLLQKLKVNSANFKKLSLDVCNAARTYSTSLLHGTLMRQAQGEVIKNNKIEARRKEVGKEILEKSALAVLCRELGQKQWTPVIAGWDGYVSVANLDVGPGYVYVDDDGKELTGPDVLAKDMLITVNRDLLTRNIGRKLHMTPLMLGQQSIDPKKMLVKDLMKAPKVPPTYTDGKTPIRGLQYRKEHKFVLQYVNKQVVNIGLDAYQNAI